MDHPVTVEGLREALSCWQHAESVLAKGRDGYDGYSFGYAFSYEIDAESAARSEVTDVLNAFVDQRVEARLIALGLMPPWALDDKDEVR